MAVLHLVTGVVACVAARAEARDGKWLSTLAWMALALLQAGLLAARLIEQGAA